MPFFVSDSQQIGIYGLDLALYRTNRTVIEIRFERTVQEIETTTTKCNYGGVRYWFKCPQCSQRIGKLYRPPISTYFACRFCHDLRYKLCYYHRSPYQNMVETLREMKNRV